MALCLSNFCLQIWRILLGFDTFYFLELVSGSIYCMYQHVMSWYTMNALYSVGSFTKRSYLTAEKILKQLQLRFSLQAYNSPSTLMRAITRELLPLLNVLSHLV